MISTSLARAAQPASAVRKIRRADTRARVTAMLAAVQPRSTVLKPLTPAGYLRLRRNAARMTIDQVAERIEPRLHRRGDIATMLRNLERDGVTARQIDILRPLQRAFPIDLEVYAQLRDEPADRHPSVCRVCGCSANDRCTGEHRGQCRRETADLCSACEPALEGGQ